VLWIRDVYPGSRILIYTHPESRILDPKTATKERVENKFIVIPFFVATNFTKFKIFLPQKLSISFQKYGFGIRDPRLGSRKTYSGSRIQGSKRHRIPDPGIKKAPDPGFGSATLVKIG
jgi:hypothetical protein